MARQPNISPVPKAGLSVFNDKLNRNTLLILLPTKRALPLPKLANREPSKPTTKRPALNGGARSRHLFLPKSDGPRVGTKVGWTAPGPTFEQSTSWRTSVWGLLWVLTTVTGHHLLESNSTTR